MRSQSHLFLFLFLLFQVSCSGSQQIPADVPSKPVTNTTNAVPTDSQQDTITLPPPRLTSAVSVEEALDKRRSIRSFTEEPLTVAELSQLLWAAQGITEPNRGFRTAPSAGATYPLETYLLVYQSTELEPGAYKYIPQGHKLQKVRLKAEGEWQDMPSAAVIVFAAVNERTTQKYGERGITFVHLEAGHAAENICLQAVALGLATVVNGIFNEEKLSQMLNLPPSEKLLYLVRIGHQRQ